MILGSEFMNTVVPGNAMFAWKKLVIVAKTRYLRRHLMTTKRLNGYFHEKVLEDVGEVSVDSGTLLICDPCYLLSHGLTEEALEEISQVTLGQPRKMCGPAVYTQFTGVYADQKPLGFVTTTGYGDGGYKVYVEKTAKEGRIKSITVVFITEKQEHESE